MFHWITVQIISHDSSSTEAMNLYPDSSKWIGIPTTAKIVWDSDCYRSIRYPGCNKGFNPDRCYNILGSWQLQSVEILTDVTIDWDPGYYIIESRELQ